MEHIDHYPPDQKSSSDSKPEDLLEESWFFGNPLDRNTNKAILRCCSDPCPSSSTHSQEMQARNSPGGNNPLPMEKVSSEGGFDHPPSLPPPCTVAREEVREEKAMSKSVPVGSMENTLLRAPSLPPCIGREEDVEGDFALSKLIRQASLNSPKVLPPKRSSKVIKQTSTVSRYRPVKNPELESIDMEASCNDMRRLCLDKNKILRKTPDQKKILRKTMSNVDFKEVSRYRDMGFDFDKGDSKTSEDKSPAPPIPSWVDSKSSSSSSVDMKAQIKNWARSVAANVR